MTWKYRLHTISVNIRLQLWVMKTLTSLADFWYLLEVSGYFGLGIFLLLTLNMGPKWRQRHTWLLLLVWIAQELLIVFHKSDLIVFEQLQVRLVQLNKIAHIGEFFLYFSSQANLFGASWWTGASADC